MAIRMIETQEPATTQTTASVWTITPDLAGDWLVRAGANRALTTRTVNLYAAAMAAGEWQVTGETIKFDTHGTLVDGQHRLAAIVQSDVTIQSLVAFDVDVAAFDVMDSGRQRSGADVLEIHGYGNAKRMAAAVRLIIVYQRSGSFNRGGGDAKVRLLPSKPEVLRFVQDNPRIIEVARIAGYIRFGATAPALLVALYYLFEQVDDQDCVVFFEKLSTGASLASTDPIFQLRKRLLDNAGATSKMQLPMLGALCIKAWNAWRAGDSIKQLSYRPGGATAEPYPSIT